jgi:hypothetical protein
MPNRRGRKEIYQIHCICLSRTNQWNPALEDHHHREWSAHGRDGQQLHVAGTIGRNCVLLGWSAADGPREVLATVIRQDGPQKSIGSCSLETDIHLVWGLKFGAVCPGAEGSKRVCAFLHRQTTYHSTSNVRAGRGGDTNISSPPLASQWPLTRYCCVDHWWGWRCGACRAQGEAEGCGSKWWRWSGERWRRSPSEEAGRAED